MRTRSAELRGAGLAWRRFVGACLFGLLTGASAAPAAEPAASAPEALETLERMQDALRRKSFQGTFVVTAGGQARSTRISHFNVGSQQYQRVEILDGLRCEIFRHNEQVHTLWPGLGRAVVEERRPLAAFPALIEGGSERLDKVYQVREVGSDRVAGHEARVLELRPRDRLRFAHRLWTERRTGLLLRAEVLGADGTVLESVAFSELQIGVRPQPELVLGPMRQTEGYRVQRSRLEPVALDESGWMLQGVPEGFRHLSSVRRPIERPLPPAAAPSGALAATAAEPQARVEVLQTIYSDGLTHVSLFIEPFEARQHRRELLLSTGATQTLVRRQGDWWITVVGDVPVATLQAFAAGLERRR